MSGQIRSASQADCRVTEECHVPADVELMELGPLLDENGPGGATGIQSEASDNYETALQFVVLHSIPAQNVPG